MTYDRSFRAARLGHNDSGPIARTHPSKLTYVSHGNGWVTCRHSKDERNRFIGGMGGRQHQWYLMPRAVLEPYMNTD